MGWITDTKKKIRERQNRCLVLSQIYRRTANNPKKIKGKERIKIAIDNCKQRYYILTLMTREFTLNNNQIKIIVECLSCVYNCGEEDPVSYKGCLIAKTFQERRNKIMQETPAKNLSEIFP